MKNLSVCLLCKCQNNILHYQINLYFFSIKIKQLDFFKVRILHLGLELVVFNVHYIYTFNAECAHRRLNVYNKVMGNFTATHYTF